eukprot:4532098-Pleurochrysis_carterae.AAC.4
MPGLESGAFRLGSIKDGQEAFFIAQCTVRFAAHGEIIFIKCGLQNTVCVAFASLAVSLGHESSLREMSLRKRKLQQAASQECAPAGDGIGPARTHHAHSLPPLPVGLAYGDAIQAAGGNAEPRQAGATRLVKKVGSLYDNLQYTYLIYRMPQVTDRLRQRPRSRTSSAAFSALSHHPRRSLVVLPLALRPSPAPGASSSTRAPRGSSTAAPGHVEVSGVRVVGHCIPRRRNR